MTAPAPTMAFLPTVIPHIIVAFAPITARSFIKVGVGPPIFEGRGFPFLLTALGYLSLIKQAWGPIKTPSSIVTPSGIKT